MGTWTDRTPTSTTNNQNSDKQLIDDLFKSVGAVTPAPAATEQAPMKVATPIGDNPYADIINRAAQQYGVDPNLVTEVIRQESAFNPTAQSGAGAQGLMQLMPKTAEYLGVTDPYDPEQNVMAGTKYLAENLNRFGGDVNMALAAYNAGPTRIAKTGLTNLPAETQDYIEKIGSRYGALSGTKEATASVSAPKVDLKKRIKEIQQVTDTDATEFGSHVSSWIKAAEESPKAFMRSYGIAAKGLDRSILGYKLMQGEATDADKEEIKKLGFQIEQEGKLAADDPIVASATGQILPSVVNSMVQASKGALLGASVGAAAGSVVPGVGSVAGAGIGATSGALMYPLKEAYKLESGGAFLDMTDRGVDEDVARVAANMYGTAATALEATGLKYLKHIIPGGNKVVNKIFKTAIDKTIAKMTNPAVRAMGRLGLGSTVEAGVEATQQLVQNITEEIAAYANDAMKGTKLAPEDAKTALYNIKKGVAETFAITLLGMGIVSLPGVGINLLTDTKAGREAAADAVKENPDQAPEETIKKKAAKKRAQTTKKSTMEKAATENEKKKLETKKPKQPIAPIIPDTGEGRGPDGPNSTPTYPDRTPAPAPVTPAVPPAPVVEKNRPIADIFNTKTVTNPNTGTADTVAAPSLHEFISKHGGGNPADNAYVTMMMREDTKGLFQNKLVQPAILLSDGTVVEGSELTEPWKVSDFAKDSTKSSKILSELETSYKKARDNARNSEKDVAHAKAGFIVDGKFVPSAVIVGKYKIGKNIAKQKKEIRNETEAKFKDEVDAINAARQAWAEKVQNSRELTETDKQAAEKLEKAALKAARKASNLDIGKHLDPSDLQSAAREALVMLLLDTDPAIVDAYNRGERRPYFGFMVNSIGNLLKNYKKETLGAAQGLNRSQVDTALKEGTFKTPLPHNEAVIGETVDRNAPVEGISERADLATEGMEAAPAQGALQRGPKIGETPTWESMKPGVVRRINPATGEVIEEVAPAVQRLRLAERKAQLKKESAARTEQAKKDDQALIDRYNAKGVSEESANAISRMAERELENINRQLNSNPALEAEADAILAAAENAKPAAQVVDVTPSEKLGKTEQAKPAKKKKKPALSKQTVAETKNTVKDISHAAMLELRKELLKTEGAVSTTKNSAGFTGLGGARLRANTLNKKDGAGTWEVIPDPKSLSNWLVVKSDLFMELYDKLADKEIITAPEVDANLSAPTPAENFVGGQVPTQGSVFDQIKKQQAKVEKAAEETITDLFGNKIGMPKEDESKLLDSLEEDGDVGKQALKGIKDIFGNEAGSAYILNEVIGIFYNGFDKLRKAVLSSKDTLSVMNRWRRINAEQTGLKFKNMFGKIASVSARETKKLQQLSKLIASIDRKITNDELVDALLAAEDPGLMSVIPDKLRPIAEWIRNYFDTSEQEYADMNIDISFKRRKMADLMETYMDTTDFDTFGKTLRAMGRLNQLEFVHIPLQVLKDTVAKRKNSETQLDKFKDTAKAIAKIGVSKEVMQQLDHTLVTLQRFPGSAAAKQSIVDLAKLMKKSKADPELTRSVKKFGKRMSTNEEMDIFKRKFEKKMRSLENLAAKRRQALSIADMLHHKIITKDDIDIFSLLGNYMRNKANDMAIADIRDSAMAEGLLKFQKTKPKTTSFGNWKSIPKKIKGLGFYSHPEGKEGQVWINDSILNAVTDALEVARHKGKFGVLLAKTKMMQFINFMFLPMYDMWQHAMSGAFGTFLNPIGGAERFGRSLKQVFTSDPEYLEALENGMASKPFDLTFDEYMNNVRKQALRSRHGLVATELMDWGTRILGLQLGHGTKLKGIPIVSAAYQASFTLAWKLDECIRMMTYSYLKDTGHAPQEAAQLTAKFHGDYAGVPMATRQTLNNFLFTPTFKIAMMKTFAEMALSMAKMSMPRKGFFKAWSEPSYTQRMAIGAMATGALLLAHGAIFASFGMDEDEFARRYTKRSYDQYGNPKEFVVTTSSPTNVPFRIYWKIARTFKPESTNPFETTWRNWVGELHPLWQMTYALVTNRKPDGNQIFGSLDSWDVKTLKTMDYIAESSMALYKTIKHATGIGQTMDQKQVDRMYKKTFGDIWNKVFSTLTFAYIRNAEDYRKYHQIKNMQRGMIGESKRKVRGNDLIPKDWYKNFRKRSKQIMED